MTFIKKENPTIDSVIPKQDLRYFDQEILRRNLLLRIKKIYLETKSKIHSLGMCRFTIMITPHSGAKGLTLHISNYLLIFTILISFITFISATFVISRGEQNKRNQERLVVENGALESKIDSVSQTVESLSEYFSKFQREVATIINSPIESSPIASLNDSDLSIDNANRAPKEIVLLRKLEKELDVTKEKIFHIGNFIQANKRVLREIPSIYPVATRARITSRFGVRRNPFDHRGYEGHDGLDLATIPGTPVYSSADGIISKAGMQGGYGNLIEIQHKYGFKTRYGHLQGFASQVYPNARVKQGQIIGYVGATGRVTGYHLHYEVLIGNLRVDPEPFAMMLR